tara:strand:+ start:363 stop:557 length:195 start_codon:yes stop_codon:yes gene_type:complete
MLAIPVSGSQTDIVPLQGRGTAGRDHNSTVGRDADKGITTTVITTTVPGFHINAVVTGSVVLYP